MVAPALATPVSTAQPITSGGGSGGRRRTATSAAMAATEVSRCPKPGHAPEPSDRSTSTPRPTP